MATNQDVGLFNNDLYTVDGDFAIVESDVQHVSDTIAAFPGWWKENPTDGVGLFKYLHSAGREQVLQRSVKINLLSDGYNADKMQISTDRAGKLTVTPNAQKL